MERTLAPQMRVELLNWAGCPSHPEARELLAAVLAERAPAAEVVAREVTTREEGEQLRVPGSPTILVDGRDVDPHGTGGGAMLARRIHHLPDGRVSPVPTCEMMEAVLT
jgi:hypothetical protein